MTRALHVATWITVLIAGTARADVIVPNAAAGVEADGIFALTSTAAAGRTFQMTIEAGQLTGMIGEQITGMQFRLNGAAAANWPPVGATASFAFWDIFMGPGVDPSAMSNTFASNFTGASTQVRSGPLSFASGEFSSGSMPNSFGPAITFNTPFVYNGGDLAIEMRFAALTGTTTNLSTDATNASGGPGNGWGVNFSARWTANSAGTTGGNGNFLSTNFVTQPIPEPTSMTLAGVAFASVACWRKLRRRAN